MRLGLLLCSVLAAALHGAAAQGDADLARAKTEFLKRFGDSYGYGNGGRRIDELYSREIAPRLPADEHYLDYTGSSLYWNSQIEATFKELEGAVFGNPHSSNPSSLRTEALVEGLRLRVLRFLGADPGVYDLVWTRSGTGALHNLGETFPWSKRSRYAYFVSNHNSVLGIREYARREGAAFGAVTKADVEAWLAGSSDAALPPILRKATHGQPPEPEAPAAAAEGAAAEAAARLGGWRELAATTAPGLAQQQQQQQPALVLPSEAYSGGGSSGSSGGSSGSSGSSGGGGEEEGGEERGPAVSLFAYPAYDNFAGHMYPLDWVAKVQAMSTPGHRWKVLLDAAAFLPSHPLNLTQTPADYVDISFYKLFGFPTGVGAWVARAEDVAAARKVYWGGGSVFLATAALDWRALRPQGPERFEDGTLPFLNVMALQQGLDVYASLGGPAAIEHHTNALRDWLADQLASLRHSNGAPLLRLAGHDGSSLQGSTFNMQILKPNGELFSYRQATLVLAAAGFHARSGCCCNPGECYKFVGVTDEEVREAAERAHGNWSDWEWVWVCRPADAPSPVPTGGSGAPPAGLAAAAAACAARGRWRLVKLPLGSLRTSFGYMSRFEDAYALVAFLRGHYTDRTEDDDVNGDLLMGMADAEPGGLEGGASLPARPAAGGSGGGGGDAAAAAAAAHRAQRRLERLRWAAQQGSPGWC